MAELNTGNGIFMVDRRIPVTVEKRRPGTEYRVRIETADEMDQVWGGEIILPAAGPGRFLLEDVMTSLEFRHMKKGRPLSALKMMVFNRLKKSAAGECRRMFYRLGADSFPVHMTLCSGSRPEDRKSIELRFRAADVEAIPVQGPFTGRFYRPRDIVTKGSVLVLGGSTGGLAWSDQAAALLASRGYAALALSYFDFRGAGGRPRRLEEIPLEYFKSAIDWLKGETGEDQAGILGISKGAEAALLTASVYAGDIRSAAAYVPSGYAFEGVYTGRRRNRSSWSLGGKPVPFLSYPEETKLGMFMREGELLRIHRDALDRADAGTVQAAALPVDRIGCPLLLISAGRDATWPSSYMAEDIVRRMEQAGRGGQVIHRDYPGAGHCFQVPGLPPLTDSEAVDAAAMAKANRQAWDEVLAFFGETV